jgi:pSer/pThr/pTyr-binding forkhead associated (FHA) protein
MARWLNLAIYELLGSFDLYVIIYVLLCAIFSMFFFPSVILNSEIYILHQKKKVCDTSINKFGWLRPRTVPVPVTSCSPSIQYHSLRLAFYFFHSMDSISHHLGSDSPPSRQNILTSFLRGRPRGTSQSNPSPVVDRDSPPLPTLPSHLLVSPPSPGANSPSHRRRSTAAPGIQQSTSHNLPISSGITQMLRRRRSGGALASSNTPQLPTIVASNTQLPSNMPALSNVPGSVLTGVSHRIRLVPHLDSRRSLRFDPITRDVAEGDTALRIGRFTERSGVGITQANAINSNKLAFKSKVVSRAHAEVWSEPGGKFFIRDTKSSSGTFLNHVRLSPANQDSRPFELRDGDTLQLGVDYQGGTEDIYKCVRIRVEIGREWQTSANAFKCVTTLLLLFFGNGINILVCQYQRVAPAQITGNDFQSYGDQIDG